MQRLVLVISLLVPALTALPVDAANLAFEGSLRFQIATLVPVTIAGSGVAAVNGSGGEGHLTALQLPAGAFATTRQIPITDPAASPILGLQLTAANGAGSFAGSGGAGFGGVMPLLGVAKICLFGPCNAAIANLSVPLSAIGQGGAVTATGVVNLTAYGAPWTTGTAAVGSSTVMGGVAPHSNTGAPSGVVSLVTPAFVRTSIGASAAVPVFAFLDLHFVPEPGTFVLLALGIVGLGAAGRARTS